MLFKTNYMIIREKIKFFILKKILSKIIFYLSSLDYLSITHYLTIKNDKPKKEKYFKDCKLVKINERKRCVFHNNRNDIKNILYF